MRLDRLQNPIKALGLNFLMPAACGLWNPAGVPRFRPFGREARRDSSITGGQPSDQIGGDLERTSDYEVNVVLHFRKATCFKRFPLRYRQAGELGGLAMCQMQLLTTNPDEICEILGFM